MDTRIRERIPLEDLQVEGEEESVNYLLKCDEHPDFVEVEREETDFDQEKSSCWISLVLQRVEDGRYFSWGYQESPWWNSDSLSPKELVEVFPKKVTKIIYE